MKKLEQIQAQVNEIQTATQKAAADLQTKIDEATKERTAATAALLQAQETGDPAAYATAAAEVRTRGDILELYSKNKTKLDTTPRITPDQYQAMKTATIEALDEASAAAAVKIRKVMKDLEAIRDELNPVMDHGRAMLLQIDLLNAPGSKPASTYTEHGPDGGRLDTPTAINSILENVTLKYIRGEQHGL